MKERKKETIKQTNKETKKERKKQRNKERKEERKKQRNKERKRREEKVRKDITSGTKISSLYLHCPSSFLLQTKASQLPQGLAEETGR